MFTINGRFTVHRITGMQRYAHEVTKRFTSHPALIKPARRMAGLGGHLWEQTILPIRAGRQMLWSPCNTGPVFTGGHIVTIHDIIPADHPEWYSKRFAGLYAVLMPLILRSATHLVAVSNYTKTRLIEKFHVPDKKITVIENGIGSEFRLQPPELIAGLKQTLGIGTRSYILSVCSLEPRKNLQKLLAAWDQIKDQLENVVLVVTGAKGSSSVFKRTELSADSDRVIFTGYIADKDLPTLYSGAACFVYPSLYEGFGLPVLEALACGCPVVTSRCTSIPEIAGPTSILVDPLNIYEIASAIKGVVSSGPLSTLEVARNCAHASSYTWEACAASTELLISSFC